MPNELTGGQRGGKTAAQQAQKTLDTLKPLLEKFRTQQAATYETLEEIFLVLGGGITRAKQYEQLERTFSTLWQGRYGNVPYRFDYKIDRPQELRLLKMMPIEEIEARMARYVRSSDGFFVKCKHTFGIFVKTINQHAVEQRVDGFTLTDEDDQAALDCSHTPRCADDVIHTRRISAERRGTF